MQIPPRTASHPSGQQIVFHHEAHEYILNGEKLTSVTTLVRKWFPQFDAEAVAKKKAEREGGSHEVLMLQWARTRDEAALFGTKAHLMAEKILQEKDESAADYLAETTREKAYLAAIKEALKRIALGYDVIESEKIVFSPGKKVAGTIDLLLRSKTNGEYVVGDWKTNREIKRESYRQEMGTGLCRHLENCNLNHYSLQTAAYGELLTREGYVPQAGSVRGVLLHLVEKDGRIICDYVKSKDLSNEARLILENPV